MKTMEKPKIKNPGSYHYSSFIEEIIENERTGLNHVKWLFPNGHRVELVFKSMEEAELKYVSPEVILPEEGEEGNFYTSREIHLFLTRIKNL